MVNVRRGISIRVGFSVYRNGLPEDLSQAQNIRVVVSHKSLPNSSAVFTGSAVKVVGNSVSVVVSDIMQRTMSAGQYYIEVAYRLVSPTAPDGYDPYIVDADVFELVERSLDPNDIAIQTVNIPGEVSFSSQALDEILVEASGAVQAANAAAQAANDAADAAMAIVDSKVDIDGLNANVKRLQFDTTNPTAPMQIGQIAWDNDEHTLVTHDGLHSHPLGKELELRARNTSGANILNGRACYVTGSTGDNPTIALATNTDGDVAQKTIGVATMDIANNAFGIVTTFGEVNDIDTSALTLGAIVYLGANGLLTTTEPVAPTPKIVIGLCVRQHAQVGKLFVSTRPIARLSKLSEVHAPTLTDNDVLRYNGTTLRWEVYSLANKADLVGGKIPSTQLPAYVDDVLEFANLAAFPATGEAGKIYVALNTNLTYRWSGTAYVEISKSLALGETADTAYRGDRGKTAYDHSQTTGNPHNTTAAQIPNTPAGTVAATTVQGAINELAGDIVQVETDLNTTGFDVNNKKISIVANTSSYTSMPVKLYAGRRYKIVNTTDNVAKFRDSNNLIAVYAQKNTTYESITMPRDVVLINGVFGTGVVEVEPLDIVKSHSFRDKILHSSVVGLCSFIEEIHLVDYHKYDSFKVLISTANTFIRIIGVKNGIYTNITGYIYYNNWKPGDIIPLESVGYIIANKNYVPYGDFVEYDLTNVRLEDNPTIRLYLYSTNDTFIKYITVNSDPSAVADFVGNNAIQQAIDSISDASEKKQYVIRCTGNFLFSKITDYRYSAGSGVWSAIWGKSYVHIDGISNDNCILRAELSDVLSDVQSDVPVGGQPFVKDSYGMTMLCQWNVNSNISNVTLIARNIRYPLHTDGSEFGCQNYEETYKNCILSHEGKFGDAIGTNGGSASGFGLSSGQKIIFENCKFDTTHYCHTNKDYVDGAYAIYRDCEFISKKASITNGIGAICLDSPVKSNYIFERCRFDKNSFVSLNTALYNYTNPIAEKVADINVIAKDVEPMPIYSASTNCKVLRITSLSTGVSSNVRFGIESTAFNYIVGDNSIETETTDNLFRKCKFGYKYRDGGVGLSGYAQGQWNIHEGAVRGYYVTALGKRLGNCLAVNKALTVIIDSISYNVVFNKDYTNLTNAEIIAEINSVIGSVATAEVIDVNKDWYPDFGYTEVLVNGDSTAILRGMGVVISSGNLRRAKNSDGYIDGIALNDAATNGYCRFMTRGRLSISGLSNYIIYRIPGQQTGYYNIAENSKWGISTVNDGMFDINATPKLVKKTYNDSCEIIR